MTDEMKSAMADCVSIIEAEEQHGMDNWELVRWVCEGYGMSEYELMIVREEVYNELGLPY